MGTSGENGGTSPSATFEPGTVTHVYRSFKRLAQEFLDWHRTPEGEARGWPSDAAQEFVAALVASAYRRRWLGMIVLLLTLISPSVFVSVQIVLLVYQNGLIDRQNDKIDIQNVLLQFEQTSRFRSMLSPGGSGARFGKPNSAVIEQIVLLATERRQLSGPSQNSVTEALMPLLQDDDVVVSTGAVLVRHRLGEMNCQSAWLQAAKLTGENLSGIDLSDGELEDAQMADIILEGANLTGADLSRANLARAMLDGADLSLVSLDNANLENATLRNADLKDAILWKYLRNVREADFHGVRNAPEGFLKFVEEMGARVD